MTQVSFLQLRRSAHQLFTREYGGSYMNEWPHGWPPSYGSRAHRTRNGVVSHGTESVLLIRCSSLLGRLLSHCQMVLIALSATLRMVHAFQLQPCGGRGVQKMACVSLECSSTRALILSTTPSCSAGWIPGSAFTAYRKLRGGMDRDANSGSQIELLHSLR
jgi:hypothetical protein